MRNFPTISRYAIPVTLLSAKEKGQGTFCLDAAQKTLTLRLSLLASIMHVDCSDSEVTENYVANCLVLHSLLQVAALCICNFIFQRSSENFVRVRFMHT